MKYGILSIAENNQSKFPCSFFYFFTTAGFFHISDVVRSTNKDEDVRYKDRVHRKIT